MTDPAHPAAAARGELLGRERELGALRAFACESGMAVVHGPAGIGKSALLDGTPVIDVEIALR